MTNHKLYSNIKDFKGPKKLCAPRKQSETLKYFNKIQSFLEDATFITISRSIDDSSRIFRSKIRTTMINKTSSENMAWCLLDIGYSFSKVQGIRIIDDKILVLKLKDGKEVFVKKFKNGLLRFLFTIFSDIVDEKGKYIKCHFSKITKNKN